QAARGSLLARPHLSPLPLRDPAEPEPALLVFSPGAGLVSHARGRVQPPGGAGGSLVRLRPAAGPPHGRRPPRRLPGPADPERQPVLPQLADHRGRRGLLRRRRARAAAARLAADAALSAPPAGERGDA